MHCPKCHILVAPNDPERVVRGEQVFHGKCLQEKPRQISMRLAGKPVQKQRYFRFVAAQMIH